MDLLGCMFMHGATETDTCRNLWEWRALSSLIAVQSQGAPYLSVDLYEGLLYAERVQIIHGKVTNV